jgi:hypothetical protein
MFRGTTVFVPAGFRSDGRRLDDGAGFEALRLGDLPELSAEDLASGLQASRNSISQGTRTLVHARLIERRRRRGERSHCFRVKPGAWHSELSFVGFNDVEGGFEEPYSIAARYWEKMEDPSALFKGFLSYSRR